MLTAVAVFSHQSDGRRPWGRRMGFLLFAVAPSVAMLIAFIFLGFVMHMSLGQWPEAIGTRGFSPALAWLADVTMASFGVMILTGVAAVPIGIIALVFSRTAAAFFGAYVLSFIVLVGLMSLAPAGFLNWWMD